MEFSKKNRMKSVLYNNGHSELRAKLEVPRSLIFVCALNDPLGGLAGYWSDKNR